MEGLNRFSRFFSAMRAEISATHPLDVYNYVYLLIPLLVVLSELEEEFFRCGYDQKLRLVDSAQVSEPEF